MQILIFGLFDIVLFRPYDVSRLNELSHKLLTDIISSHDIGTGFTVSQAGNTSMHCLLTCRPPGGSDTEISTRERTVYVEDVINQGGHLFGQHTVRLSPIR